mmetsp:Transcript_6668/g.17131  ORF Transcript_6668/g.17131 Transcript_6668/m.17131 type:complete len:222 (+) Transcript_6668:955-1620(+)
MTGNIKAAHSSIQAFQVAFVIFVRFGFRFAAKPLKANGAGAVGVTLVDARFDTDTSIHTVALLTLAWIGQFLQHFAVSSYVNGPLVFGRFAVANRGARIPLSRSFVETGASVIANCKAVGILTFCIGNFTRKTRETSTVVIGGTVTVESFFVAGRGKARWQTVAFGSSARSGPGGFSLATGSAVVTNKASTTGGLVIYKLALVDFWLCLDDWLLKKKHPQE